MVSGPGRPDDRWCRQVQPESVRLVRSHPEQLVRPANLCLRLTVDDAYGNILVNDASQLLVTIGGPDGLINTNPYQPLSRRGSAAVWAGPPAGSLIVHSGKGPSQNSAFLTPDPLALSVYVRVLWLLRVGNGRYQ